MPTLQKVAMTAVCFISTTDIVDREETGEE